MTYPETAAPANCTLHIGANIRKLRKVRKLTQSMLAKELMVSYQSISAWERGQSLPDLENALRIAHLFGVSLDALVTGE